MFYLGQFFKNVFLAPIKGGFFLFLTIAFIVVGQHRDYFEGFFKDRTKLATSYPYFNVLIAKKVDPDYLVQKLRNLPGVYDVIPQSSGYLKNKVQGLVDDLGESIPQTMMTENYSGMKIILEQNVTNRSVKLIREYLGRLFAEDEISMTSVKGDANKHVVVAGMKLNDSTLLSSGIVWGMWILLGLLWFFSLGQYVRGSAESSYLIESYQRRKHVALKVLFVGLFSIFGVLFLASFTWQIPLMLESVIICIVFTVGSTLLAGKKNWKY